MIGILAAGAVKIAEHADERAENGRQGPVASETSGELTAPNPLEDFADSSAERIAVDQSSGA